MSIDESSLWRAVHCIEEAAAKADRAADRAEEAARRLAFLLEDGYGGNGLRLIELLESAQQIPTVPEGWVVQTGFDVIDKPFQFVDNKSHLPTITVILPACEVNDSASWDMRDIIAKRISSILAQQEGKP